MTISINHLTEYTICITKLKPHQWQMTSKIFSQDLEIFSSKFIELHRFLISPCTSHTALMKIKLKQLQRSLRAHSHRLLNQRSPTRYCALFFSFSAFVPIVSLNFEISCPTAIPFPRLRNLFAPRLIGVQIIKCNTFASERSPKVLLSAF